MKIKEIMTKQLATCTPTSNLRDVAKMMKEHDCGLLPVLKEEGGSEVVGVVSDRDIVIRAVAEGKNPLDMNAGDCMSTPVYTVSPDDGVDDCCDLMEEHKVRRCVVVDEDGCCGIVAQADIAREADSDDAGDVVEEVSEPTEKPRQ